MSIPQPRRPSLLPLGRLLSRLVLGLGLIGLAALVAWPEHHEVLVEIPGGRCLGPIVVQASQARPGVDPHVWTRSDPHARICGTVRDASVSVLLDVVGS